MNILTPIFLLHGLGCSPITLLPLELYLNYKGYKNTYRISYPASTLRLDKSIEYVDNELSEKANKSKDEIILIGQSLGGRIANELYSKGWKIKFAIYIGSPLSGARLLNQLESWVPTRIRNLLYKTPYDDLKIVKNKLSPPHPHHCITMGWANMMFDGCVYVDEGKIDDDNHTHLSWADHTTIFANPRLWWCVDGLLKKID